MGGKCCKKGANPNKPIKMSELAKHNTKASAWLALEGKVFDVTEFADRHPGGYEKIALGFGTDATDLFKQVHAYVDYEKVLEGKQIGVLQV